MNIVVWIFKKIFTVVETTAKWILIIPLSPLTRFWDRLEYESPDLAKKTSRCLMMLVSIAFFVAFFAADASHDYLVRLFEGQIILFGLFALYSSIIILLSVIEKDDYIPNILALVHIPVLLIAILGRGLLIEIEGMVFNLVSIYNVPYMILVVLLLSRYSKRSDGKICTPTAPQGT